METAINQKKEHLLSIIKEYGSLLVAFSGGVDSTFLLAVARQVLKDNLVAVTSKSPVHPLREHQTATDFAKNLGVDHRIIQSREMSRPDFLMNNKDRCYICKKYLFEDLLKIARDKGIEYVAHGANIDDLQDFRPGFAAADEMGIKAPLVDAGLTKDDIRALSKEMNLATWNKPSMACLATRIPYGTPITKKALNIVEQAEYIILDLGFTACRVRLHGTTARIEVDSGEIEKMLDPGNRSAIIEKLKEIGFSHISVDLEGYRQGSMNLNLA
jgi:uncharacterized protein